jgi:hypothetical protein
VEARVVGPGEGGGAAVEAGVEAVEGARVALEGAGVRGNAGGDAVLELCEAARLRSALRSPLLLLFLILVFVIARVCCASDAHVGWIAHAAAREVGRGCRLHGCGLLVCLITGFWLTNKRLLNNQSHQKTKHHAVAYHSAPSDPTAARQGKRDREPKERIREPKGHRAGRAGVRGGVRAARAGYCLCAACYSQGFRSCFRACCGQGPSSFSPYLSHYLLSPHYLAKTPMTPACSSGISLESRSRQLLLLPL